LEAVDGVLVVRIRGTRILSEENAREMGDALNAALDASTPSNRVVIDLAPVQMLSSAALAKLIMFKRRLKERGGSMALCRLGPHVVRAFQLTNLTGLFSIHPDLDSALTSFD
jgi:anti-anti-sigma factor